MLDSPASPEPEPVTCVVNTQTKRAATPSPPASPSRFRCESPLYIPLQDHQYAVPEDCPIVVSPTLRDPSIGMTGEVWPPNPALQRPQPRRPQRRRAPSPPTSRPQRGRISSRRASSSSPPYRLPSRSEQSFIPGERSVFRNPTFPRGRARNLFSDFVASLPSLPVPRIPSPRPRSPSPDLFLELYSHTRHPLDLTSHLTILPSWGMKAEEEKTGECVICYRNEKHLQVKCKNCGNLKVCCGCIIGVYQSINSCPICRFRGEF